MNPTVLKLVNGETIIAEVTESKTPLCKEVSEVFIIRTGISQNNKMVLSLMPWMESDQKSFTIREEHIVSQAEPSEVVKSHYNMYKNEVDDDDPFDEDDLDEEANFLDFDDEDEETKTFH